MQNEEKVINKEELGKFLATLGVGEEIISKFYKFFGNSLIDAILEYAEKYKAGEISKKDFEMIVRVSLEPYFEHLSEHGKVLLEIISQKILE